MIKRKGFTLVELLIVVVIMGVLTSMMSISSVGSTDSAKASAIIGNLVTMRKAALADYIENGDTNWTDADSVREAIAAYMNTKETAITAAKFSVLKQDAWYILYEFQTDDSSSVKDKIAGKANLTGLYAATAATTVTNNIYTNVANNTHVAIKVR
ncbi:MAG: type II secretion system protein [Synergistaceae bacterium]|nr:type II secretion system protein [Synergistaceae bacterium]